MQALKQFRESTGLSQEKMAQRLGCSVSMYIKVERGKTQASKSFLDKFKEQFPTASIDDVFYPQYKSHKED